MISIVIVNYNVSKHLIACVKSIYRSKIEEPFEIIVIDNDSTELFDFNLLPSSKRDKLKFIQLDNNLGFAKAVNYAIGKSSGSKILLLNPDTLVYDDTISCLSNYIDSSSDVGIVGSKVIFPSGEYQLSSKRHFPTISILVAKLFRLNKIFSRSKYFGRYNYTYLNHDELAAVDSVSGSCMMFSKKVFEDIGPFDESFFLYFEDTDFCYRAIKKQYKVVYNPYCKIVHYKRESFINSNISFNLELYKSFYVFYNKYIDDYKNSFFTKFLVKYFLLFYIKLLERK